MWECGLAVELLAQLVVDVGVGAEHLVEVVERQLRLGVERHEARTVDHEPLHALLARHLLEVGRGREPEGQVALVVVVVTREKEVL